MESIGLEMEDIFGAEVNDTEDVGAGQNVLESTENPDDENTFDANLTAKLDKGAAKKVVRNPQPKLDPQRLSSQRGIAILPKLFENVKFKGKGFEVQDLEKVIKGLEHWAHRLFPKRTFDECLQRIEKLGNKREVKTCIKKIRLDMPVLDEDFVSKPEEGVENADIGPQDEINEAEHAFDEMMQTSTPLPSRSSYNSQTSVGLSPSPQLNFSGKSKTVLSDELKEKIERNRRLALERRTQKLQSQILQDPKILPSIPSSENKEKESQDASTMQCQDLAAAASVAEPSSITADIIITPVESVDSSDDDDEQVTSFDKDIHKTIDGNTSSETNKDSLSSVGDKLHSDDKRPLTPVCDESIDNGTHKTVGDCSPPIKTNKDMVPDDNGEMHSDDKRPLTPVCDESIDNGTHKTIGDCSPPIKTNKDMVPDDNGEMHSDDKRPLTPVCDESIDNGTHKTIGDCSPPIKTNKDMVPDDNGEMHSDDKRPLTPVCDESIDNGTHKTIGDCSPPIKTNKDMVPDDNGEMHSDDKRPLTPVCDESIDNGTHKTVGDCSPPIKTNKDMVPDDNGEMHSDDKRPLTPVCDESIDNGTHKTIGDCSPPIKTNKDMVPDDNGEMHSDDKRPLTPVCDES